MGTAADFHETAPVTPNIYWTEPFHHIPMEVFHIARNYGSYCSTVYELKSRFRLLRNQWFAKSMRVHNPGRGARQRVRAMRKVSAFPLASGYGEILIVYAPRRTTCSGSSVSSRFMASSIQRRWVKRRSLHSSPISRGRRCSVLHSEPGAQCAGVFL